ncbi:MAG: mechanosensitive ion channel family protein [Clostridia bacterium]|jgi:MscS family membrane protein|nr:mechanosensitive ion channel family protein [Clostridia bacterium]
MLSRFDKPCRKIREVKNLKELLDAFLFNYDYIPFSPYTLIPWSMRIGIALGIFLFVFFLRKFFTRRILAILHRFTSKTKTEIDNYLLNAFEKPFRMFFVVLGIYLALMYLPLSLETNILLSKIFRSALVVLVSLGFYNLTGNYIKFADEMAGLINLKIDKILLPFLSKVIRFIIIVLALSVILQEWDYDINGFIAGLGLGGLAFALAAQQTLANLFGGIVIITDKPFSIGDWILTPSVEGTVQDINFRSTKVRTFAQAVVTIPNATLANEPITNWTRMGKRRITFNLGVTYSTPKEKLEICVQEIKNMLQKHPGIHPETIFVNFDSFGASSLDIFLYFFTKTTNWGEFLQIKEDVNLKIMSILEKEGVSIAIPSTSIYFKNELKTN